MIIYLSGKITGTPDYEDRFKAAELELRKLGHIVINPVEIGKALEQSVPFDLWHDDYMAIDLHFLKRADAIYLLKGYENSMGAREEHTKAVAWGKRVYFEEDRMNELGAIRDGLKEYLAENYVEGAE